MAASGELRATLLVALSAAGWGTWSLFLRGCGIAPIWQSVMILVVVALVSLPLALRQSLARSRRARARAMDGEGAPARARAGVLIMLVALLGAFDAGNYYFFFSAIARGPVGVAVLSHYLAPVMACALAPLVLSEPLSARTPAAVVASLVGLGMLLLGAGGMHGDSVPAAILGGVSAFFYGGNMLTSKRLLRDLSGVELLSFHCFIAATLLAVLAPFVAGAPPSLTLFLGRPLVGTLLLGCLCGATFYLGLAKIPAQRAAVLTYFEPLVAALVGVFVWGEQLGALGIAGAGLILAGGIAVATAEDGPGPSPS